MDGYSEKSYAISVDKEKSRRDVDKQLGIADDPDPKYLANPLNPKNGPRITPYDPNMGIHLKRQQSATCAMRSETRV